MVKITTEYSDSNKEKEFNKLCKGLKNSIQIIPKKEIIWNLKEPLHFFQSLAFVLQSENFTCIAVSSFTNIQGINNLYIASNQTFTESQQKEITDLITLFLEMKPTKEIDAKVLPRQLFYIIKKFKKITASQLESFVQDYPGELSSLVEELLYKKRLTLNDIKPLLKLIWTKRNDIRLMKSGNTSKETKQMAFHLYKMIRIFEEINFVMKKVKLHQVNTSLVSLQFIENKNNYHSELAILNTAVDHCNSKTLYIGVSKRPCYCCSLFFKAVAECQSMKFDISIVTSNGKLYGHWNKIIGFLDNEFNIVWTKVVEKRVNIEKLDQTNIDDNSLDEDNSRI